ncbi:MAG: potassium channel family protein [Azospirillaceae bacterium]
MSAEDDDRAESPRERVERLYAGPGPAARRFRYALIAFDLATIAYFLVWTMTPPTGALRVVEVVIAVVLGLDLAARLWIAHKPWRHLVQPVTLADIAVLVGLIAPALIDNLAFLRVLRAMRLLRSYHVLHDLRGRFTWFAVHEEVVFSAVNLAVFVFVVTAVVFVVQVEANAGIETYLDALYFTVATLTTTGFGDITLIGESGRLLSVVIMVVGVALFLRLLQTLFRPSKVRVTCPSCGLERHEPDAVHCKHCGRVLHIETEGE